MSKSIGTRRNTAGAARRTLAALLLACAGTAPAIAVGSNCDVITAAMQRGMAEEQTRISRQEAATKEAISSARSCMEKVLSAANKMIPGVPSVTVADFGAILDQMVNRACQVVTTQIDSAGNVVKGTVSDATNRVIGGINDSVKDSTNVPGVGNVGNVVTSRPGGTTSFTGGAPVAGTPTTVNTDTSMWSRITCVMSGGCK